MANPGPDWDGNSGIAAMNKLIRRHPAMDIPGSRGGIPDKLRPWDRMDAESDRAWEGFKYFRDMGPGRMIKAVSDDLNYDASTVGGWAQKYHWRARTHAWDTHLDQISQKAYEEEAATMGRRHAQIGMKLQTLGSGRLETIAGDEQLKGQLTVRETLDIVKAGVEIERTARVGEKANTNSGGGTINFIFNMEKPPKWAPKVIKGEGGIVEEEEKDESEKEEEKENEL